MRPSRLFLVIAATLALVAVLSLAVPASVALADQAKPDYAAAKKHYDDAEQAAHAQDWALAAKEYGIAYEITRDPVLFFKLGNTYQLSGDCTRSVEYFERYMAEANPSDEYRADIKTRIARCNSSLTNAAAAGNAGSGDAQILAPPADLTDSTAKTDNSRDTDNSATTTPGLEEALPRGEPAGAEGLGTNPELAPEQIGQPTFMDEDPTWQETAAWTSVGVSFALLSASAILGLSADSREEDLDNLFQFRDSEGNPAQYGQTVQERYETLIEEGEDLNTMAMVALGLAGVSTAGAIVFFVLDSVASKESDGISSIAPAVTRDSLGVTAGWAF